MFGWKPVNADRSHSTAGIIFLRTYSGITAILGLLRKRSGQSDQNGRIYRDEEYLAVAAGEERVLRSRGEGGARPAAGGHQARAALRRHRQHEGLAEHGTEAEDFAGGVAGVSG